MSLEQFKNKVSAKIYLVDNFPSEDVIWLSEDQDKIIELVKLTNSKFLFYEIKTMADKLKIIIDKSDYDTSTLKKVVMDFHNSVLAKWVSEHSGHPAQEYDHLVDVRRQFEKLAIGETINVIHDFTIYIPYENRVYGYKELENEFLMPDSVIVNEMKKYVI